MTLVIPPGFGNAAFIFTGSVGTPEIVTTLGVDLSEYGGDFVGAANQLMFVFNQFLGAQIGSELTLDRVNLAVGSDGPGGSVDSDLAPIQMQRSSTQQVVAMAAIARKVTNDLGRRGRGRMFLPYALNQTEVNESGVISSTRLTGLTSWLTDFYDALVEGDGIAPGMQPVLLHSQAPVDPTPITGFTVSQLVGWVRGRIR